MATYCIVCGKQKSGLPIEEDNVIRTIRWLKRNVTKDEQKNELVVCRDDYEEYKKNRDRFTTRRAIYVAIGTLMLVLGLALSLRIQTFVLGVAIIIALYIMALLNYTPKLKISDKAPNQKKQKHNQ